MRTEVLDLDLLCTREQHKITGVVRTNVGQEALLKNSSKMR